MNKNNFFIASRATWKACNPPKREPDFISYDRFGDVSSEYWYTEKGCFRRSYHWSAMKIKKESLWEYRVDLDMKSFSCGKIRSCLWKIVIHKYKESNLKTPLTGFCRWKNFREI